MLDLITPSNIANHKLIEGVVIRNYKVNKDETGILVETLRNDWNDVYNKDLPFAMQYYSVTQSGIARDETFWHYHPGGQQDRFLVISGSIVVAIADNRDESSTKNRLNLFLMESDNAPYLLVVPKQCLHAYVVVSKAPATLLNFPTMLYDPKEEGRIPFKEALIKIENNEIFSWNMVRKKFNLPLS